jgi:hypothetical protein
MGEPLTAEETLVLEVKELLARLYYSDEYGWRYCGVCKGQGRHAPQCPAETLGKMVKWRIGFEGEEFVR